MKSDTENLVEALHILAKELYRDDPFAKDVCTDAADRIVKCCALIAQATAWAAKLEQQMRREGWTQEDLDELRRNE